MLQQATFTVVKTKEEDGSSPSPSSSGLDLLFAAASQHQNRKEPLQQSVVTDCESTISSLSSDQPTAPPAAKIFFPEVLMDMLNNNSHRFDSIISWKPDGRSFVIKNRHEFKDKVLPLYFQSNFDSFLRKLKRWGFEKNKVRRRGEPSIEFAHPYFRRDESGLCLRMRCKSGPVEPSAADSSNSNIQEESQEIMGSSPSHSSIDDNLQKHALVDHLMNQQATQESLLEELNRSVADAEKLAVMTAAGRHDCTYNQALMAEQFMRERQALMNKQLAAAAKKADLARKLSEYMAAAAPRFPQRSPVNEVQQGHHNHLAQLQRLSQVLDANAHREEYIARYYRPSSASHRTQRSREALRASILAKRHEFVPSSQQRNMHSAFPSFVSLSQSSSFGSPPQHW